MNDLEVKWGTVTEKIKESVKKSPTKTIENKIIESITIDTDTEKSLRGLKVIKIDNLYEQEKYEIVMKLMEKCSLEKLQEIYETI